MCQLISGELLHEGLRVGLRHGGREHLHVGPELLVGIRVGRIAAKEHGRHHALEFKLDTGLGASVLDDGLALLPRAADRGLEDKLQLDVALGADAVSALLPASRLKHLVGLVDVEFILGIGAVKARRVVQKVGRGNGAAAVDHLLDALAVDQQRHRIAHRLVGERRVFGLDAGTLAVDLVPRVGDVESNKLDVAARIKGHLALARGLQALEDVVLHGQVPRQVVLTRLQHGASCTGGIAATLDFQRIKEGLVGHVVAGVGLGAQGVARLEVNDLVRSGTYWLGVGRVLARLGSHEGLKHMLGQDGAGAAHQRFGPERHGFGITDLHRMGIDLLDFDVFVDAHCDHGGGRVGGVSGREHHVVGGEGLAIVPGDAALQLPGHGLAIGRHAAVLTTRDLGCQCGHQVAFGVPSSERLVEDAAGVLVLGATRVVRVQVHGGLPVDDLERAAAATLGRLVRNRRLGLCDALMHQQHGRHRCCQTERHQLPDKLTPRQLADAYLFNQITYFALLHDDSPRW